MKRTLLAALVVCASLVAPRTVSVRAEDPPAPKNACPKCGVAPEDRAAAKCPKDGSPLVRSDLILLHTLIVQFGGRGPQGPKGLDNPFAPCVKDGKVDVATLEKLFQDYTALVKSGDLKPFAGGGTPGSEGVIRGNEASAVGALKTLATSEAIYREGGKDPSGDLVYGDLAALAKANLIDSVLGSGKKQGYLFVCKPSTDGENKAFLWYATATPEKPGMTGKRYFFTNQTGVVYHSRKPFEIDPKTCEAPKGAVPVGKDLPEEPAAAGKDASYDAKVVKVRADFDAMKKASQLFKLDTGKYPARLSDLSTAPAGVKNWKGPYIEQEPRDPWGNAYNYSAPAAGERLRFTCYGADGAPGGTGENADLSSQDP